MSSIVIDKKYACGEIWTHADSRPSDLESDALDRSATHASLRAYSRVRLKYWFNSSLPVRRCKVEFKVASYNKLDEQRKHGRS